MMGYLEMLVSQAFCNGVTFGETVGGIPQYGPSISDADGFKLAITRFDSAAVYLTGSDQGTLNIKYAVLVAKARVAGFARRLHRRRGDRRLGADERSSTTSTTRRRRSTTSGGSWARA